MGHASLQIKLSTSFTEEDIKKAIQKEVGNKEFTYRIEKKSLDARKKENPYWLLNLIITADSLKGEDYPLPDLLSIPYKKRKEKIIIIGSGPAGFFAGYVLQLSGFQVSILERGSEVKNRSKAIGRLDGMGEFSPNNNYAFGEGGAGTFSDGKLTSRSKHISKERSFILSEYVKAGAPEEIQYMAYPHVGTDNLKIVVKNLRELFLNKGGQIFFDTHVSDIVVQGRKIVKLKSNNGDFSGEHILFATGHSAYDTYRMLINRGVHFGTKNFAIGHRIEHAQKIINKAQWGRESLPGVKAAEYRMSTKTKSGIAVYTFCMCPGGKVVPSAAFENKSVVNGMSYYKRDGHFANSGCVVGVHPDTLIGHKSSPIEILDWMDKIEESFYSWSGSLQIPAIKAFDYIKRTGSKEKLRSSYPQGISPAPLFDMVPEIISRSLGEGIEDFSKKLNGFEKGVLMGLENKTSSPIQVARAKDGLCEGFDNLYFIGEGSGFAGGIISSAADGVKSALAIAST